MLFKRIFKWRRELYLFYTHAMNESEAFNIFTLQLAKFLKVLRRDVRYYFLNSGIDNFEIEEELDKTLYWN